VLVEAANKEIKKLSINYSSDIITTPQWYNKQNPIVSFAQQ
jgi:hypothetical protein